MSADSWGLWSRAAAQLYFGLRAGFARLPLFMAVGVLQFYLTRRYLGTAGTPRQFRARRGHRQSPGVAFPGAAVAWPGC
jgi:hypothetical protein